MTRLAGAVLATALLILGHAGPLAVVLNQAAYNSAPGDSLAVIFPPGEPVSAAVQRMGRAGTTMTDTAGVAPAYRVTVVDAAAARALSRHAWVMRIPGPPRFAGCFAPPPSPYQGGYRGD